MRLQYVRMLCAADADTSLMRGGVNSFLYSVLANYKVLYEENKEVPHNEVDQLSQSYSVWVLVYVVKLRNHHAGSLTPLQFMSGCIN